MKFSRRKFLIGTGLLGGGLILGVSLKPKLPIPNTRKGSFQPNAWLQITEDGQVIFQLDKAEMGQGVMTTLPTVLGEELDYNPEKIIIEQALIHPDFINKAMSLQLTGASSSTISSWEPLREAGAIARAMLLKAAAKKWAVSIESCSTNDGFVFHASTEKKLSYGELASDAKNIRHMSSASLKNEKDFRWIGKSLPRRDVLSKTNGAAKFGIDVDFDNIKIAVVRRCPHFGGQLGAYIDTTAKAMPGVKAIFRIHSGLVVVADTYWQARQAADELEITWQKGPLEGLTSATIRKEQERVLLEEKAQFHQEEGDFAEAFSQAQNKLSVNYAAPYFHHSPLEPQNTTAIVIGDKCEVWSPSQGPDLAQAVIAHYTGLKRENITVHTTLLGGGFGRRGYVDFAGEAGAIALAYPNVPVKLMWSREDDMQHDYYRPATYHGIQAALDSEGNITAWQHKLVSTSIIQGFGVDMFATLLPSWVPTQIARNFGQDISTFVSTYDPTMAEGAKIPYSIPNIQVGAICYDPGIPTGFWRSVGHSHNAFVVEGFIDECAHAAKQDPAAFRRKYLLAKPRHLAVLDLIVEKSNWGNSEKHQGIAVHESFESFVAQVVEVTVKDNSYSVDKVYCAVDCGLPINPDIIKAQMESGIIYALTAAMKNPVTFVDGKTEQSNFHDLPVLRINESPEIEVFIVTNFEHPSGVGEIAVPPLAPALANALFAATGQRLREMPLKLRSA